MSVADQVALDLCGEHVAHPAQRHFGGHREVRECALLVSDAQPIHQVPASQVTARSSPWGWMRKELRLPSWMPPSPPSTTTSKPSAALALGSSGRNANAASKAREGLTYFHLCERSNLPDMGISCVIGSSASGRVFQAPQCGLRPGPASTPMIKSAVAWTDLLSRGFAQRSRAHAPQADPRLSTSPSGCAMGLSIVGTVRPSYGFCLPA